MVEEEEITHVSSKNVQVKNTEWLLPDILPLGHLVLLAGEPSVGKSTLCAALVAQYTRGDWGTPGKAFIASLEEDAAHVIKPRLIAAGARESRVFFRNEDDDPIQFPNDLGRFASYLDKHRPGFVVLDSVQEFIPNMGGNKVRPVLRHLKEYARDYNTTILLICHYNRTGSSIQKALYGSSGFYQSARVVLQFGKIPTGFPGVDPEDRVLTVVKNNLGPIANPLRFSASDRKVTGAKRTFLAFELEGDMPEGPSSGAVFEYNRPKAEKHDQQGGLRDKSATFLKILLAMGEKRATEVFESASAAGHSEKTIRRAANEIGVEKTKKADGWYWSLDGTMPTIPNTIPPS